MKHTVLFALFIAFSAGAAAETLLRTLTFEAADSDGTLTISADPKSARQVLIELTDPGVSSPVYAVKGMLRYQGVAGDAYLQLDSDFGDRGVFFTKSLADAGPLQRLTGTSEWRPFTLPFFARDGDLVLTPQRLTLSIVLPRGGTVGVREVALLQYAEGENPLADVSAWFDDRTGALVGAIGGSGLGLLGALIGVLAARGRARGFVLGGITTLLVIGVVCAAAGAVALLTAQPYAVYFPLLLLGVILVVVMGSMRRTLPKRYEALELQRIRALDVR